LQYQQALGERARAAAAITARARTVDQAQRVYDLTVLRYDQGLATHLDVSDARLALLMARANHAQAIAQYYIADAALQRALGVSSAALSTIR
jgi:outer membrane protein